MTDPDLPTPTFALPIHEAIFWRGVFIHRYSGVEHGLTELLLRAGGRAEYRDLGALPYPWPKKLKKLRQIVETTGPLQIYKTDLLKMLVPFTSIEQHRHMLVHGMMSCGLGERGPRALYLKTHDRIDGELGEFTWDITIDELIAMTQDIGPIVQDFTRLVARIFRELELLPIETGERQALKTAARIF